MFGFGATLPALLAQFLALRSVAAGVVSAAGGFLATVLVALALSGQLAVSYHVLVAWLAGVVLASAVNHWLRSNNSSKPTPLRGAA